MPVTGKIKQQLSVENILRRVSDYDIYKYYLGGDFPLGKAIHSPFRKDENPSFSINHNKSGVLRHFDYGDSSFSGDVFNFVCQLFNISHAQALTKIDFDLGLSLSSSNPDVVNLSRAYPTNVPVITPISKERSIIQVVSRKFNSDELAYWNAYHIAPDMLVRNDVYAIKSLYVNKKRYPLRGDLCFGYLFNIDGKDHWKIYWPTRDKKEKWVINNVPNTHMSGMLMVDPEHDKQIVVTKSKKDEMVLSLFLPRVVSVQHETVYAITEHNLAIIDPIPSKWINFDSDETGVKASKYYNQFGYKWINCPKDYKEPKGKFIKDFADLGRYYGLEVVIAYFKRKGLIFK